MDYKILRDGEYIIKLRDDVYPIVDNKKRVCYDHNKEYKMIIKDKMCFIEDNTTQNRCCLVTPYKHLLEHFTIRNSKKIATTLL